MFFGFTNCLAFASAVKEACWCGCLSVNRITLVSPLLSFNLELKSRWLELSEWWTPANQCMKWHQPHFCCVFACQNAWFGLGSRTWESSYSVCDPCAWGDKYAIQPCHEVHVVLCLCLSSKVCVSTILCTCVSIKSVLQAFDCFVILITWLEESLSDILGCICLPEEVGSFSVLERYEQLSADIVNCSQYVVHLKMSPSKMGTSYFGSLTQWVVRIGSDGIASTLFALLG